MNTVSVDRKFIEHCLSVMRGVGELCQPIPRKSEDDPTEYCGGQALAELANCYNKLQETIAYAEQVALPQAEQPEAGRDFKQGAEREPPVVTGQVRKIEPPVTIYRQRKANGSTGIYLEDQRSHLCECETDVDAWGIANALNATTRPQAQEAGREYECAECDVALEKRNQFRYFHPHNGCRLAGSWAIGEIHDVRKGGDETIIRRAKATSRQQTQEAAAIGWLRLHNGQPDWDECCIFETREAAERYLDSCDFDPKERQEYSHAQIYLAPPASAEVKAKAAGYVYQVVGALLSDHQTASGRGQLLLDTLAWLKGSRDDAPDFEKLLPWPSAPDNAEAVRLLRKVWHYRTGYGTDVCEMLAENDYDNLCAEVETFLAQHGGRGDE